MRSITPISAAILSIILLAIPMQVHSAGGLNGKKIVMIIAHKDFNDTEFSLPNTAFRNEGAIVSVASSSVEPAKGMFGLMVNPDMLYSDIDPVKYDAILFIGGPGSVEYWNDRTAQRIAAQTIRSGKVLGAICLAPVTLANAGLLKGKKATVWPSEGAVIAAKGAEYTAADSQVDGNIVTANGPKSSGAFAEAIVKLLKK